MGAMADAFAKGQENLAAIERESTDRRALRDRKSGAAAAAAREAFAKQGPTMQRYAEHVGELVKRRQQAGGWETSSALRDNAQHLRFGFDDEAASGEPPLVPAAPPPPPPPPAPVARPAPRRPRPVTDDEDEDFSGQSWMR